MPLHRDHQGTEVVQPAPGDLLLPRARERARSCIAGYGKPEVSQGYRCIPSIQAWVGTFTCELTGADVPTTIKLTFAADWRHAM